MSAIHYAAILAARALGYHVGAAAERHHVHRAMALAERATSIAETSTATAERCVEAAAQTRAALGLWPAVGGIGGQ